MTGRKSELRRMEIIKELKEITWCVLIQDHGMEKEAAQDMAESVVEGLLKAFAGTNIYIPTRYFKEIADRRERVAQMFKGDNYYEIARELGITERAVYKILASRKSIGANVAMTTVSSHR